MTDLRMVTANEEASTLAAYWQAKYRALQDESTPATIRSLRTQLQSIAEILKEDGEAEDRLKRIAVHAAVGLTVSKQR
jgi:hypothetical protein